MLFESVEIPEGLLEALQNNKLVVFAGAGVSMGEPANYPGFGKLAEDINNNTLHLPITEQGNWDEPIDRFLGRLEHLINVKKIARNLLKKPEAEPTILHQELLNLFKTPDQVRLVTTNFDSLFNKYAENSWKQNGLDYYYAPALPLGNDFNGIVYLHGSVLRDEKHIVITDKDFGRAYLTEG
jgi:NAD-dependent SIR2 family protein deacetylase